MHRPLRSAIDLFRSKWWTIGYALAVVAYLLRGRAHADLAVTRVGSACRRDRAARSDRGALLRLRARPAPVVRRGAGVSWPGAARAHGRVAIGPGLRRLLDCRDGRLRGRSGGRRNGTDPDLPRRADAIAARRAPGVSAGLLFTVNHVAVKALSVARPTRRSPRSWAAPTCRSPWPAVSPPSSPRPAPSSSARPSRRSRSPRSRATPRPSRRGSSSSATRWEATPVAVAVRSFAFVLVVVAAALIPAPTRAAAATRRRARSRGVPPAARRPRAA
jgi:hypothetical protein